MNTTLTKIPKYLRVLIDLDSIHKILMEKFPDMLDDLVSAKTNPSCSCNQRLIESLTNKYKDSDLDKDFIEDLFSRPDVVEAIRNYDEIIEEWNRKEAEVFNTVHVVGKSAEDWSKFREFIKTQGLHIQAISVIEKNSHV